MEIETCADLSPGYAYASMWAPLVNHFFLGFMTLPLVFSPLRDVWI
jgi:hypothetical protein